LTDDDTVDTAVANGLGILGFNTTPPAAALFPEAVSANLTGGCGVYAGRVSTTGSGSGSGEVFRMGGAAPGGRGLYDVGDVALPLLAIGWGGECGSEYTDPELAWDIRRSRKLVSPS